MIRAHRDAVISALEEDLPDAVYTSYGAAKKPRYAVVFIGLAVKQRPRYTGAQARDVYTVTVHSVGGSEEHALWVQERVDRLTGLRLAVSGRRLWPVEYVAGTPPSLDDDATSPLWYVTSQFDLTSDPA